MDKRVFLAPAFTIMAVVATSPRLGLAQARAQGQAPKSCTVRGNVTWKYNEYVGTKADVGAKVILLRRFDEKRPLSPILDKTEKAKGVYVTQVDMLGRYEVDALPVGTYDMLIRSKNTARKFTIKFDAKFDYEEFYRQQEERRQRPLDENLSTQDRLIRIQELGDSIERLNYGMFKSSILVPHFEEKDYESAALLLLGTNKYAVMGNLECAAGEVAEVNQDFGITYI